MPENAYRKAHLYAHAVGVYRTIGDPQRDLALRQHPDWPLCTAGCGWPVNPSAGTTHPTCPEVPR